MRGTKEDITRFQHYHYNMGLTGIDGRVDWLVSMSEHWWYTPLTNDDQTIIGENRFALAA